MCIVEQKQSGLYGHGLVIQDVSPAGLAGMICQSLNYLLITTIKICFRGKQQALPWEKCFEKFSPVKQ